MSKLIHLEHVLVSVAVNSPLRKYATGPEKAETRHRRIYGRAEVLRDQIDRHCDFNGTLALEQIYSETCQFCGSTWTEDDDEYNGGCCNEDQDAVSPYQSENSPEKV